VGWRWYEATVYHHQGRKLEKRFNPSLPHRRVNLILFVSSVWSPPRVFIIERDQQIRIKSRPESHYRRGNKIQADNLAGHSAG